MPETWCRHPKCRKPIVRCETLPSHGGCSSAYGWIHANGGAHACEPGSDGPYALPDTAHALAPPNPANPKPYCLCGQSWPCARDVTEPITAELAAIEERQEHGDLRLFAFEDSPRLIDALRRVMEVAAKHEHNALRWQDPLPVPSWIPELREAIAAELISKESGHG